MNMYEVKNLIRRLDRNDMPDKRDIVKALSLSAGKGMEILLEHANRVRSEYVGDDILVRGIVEFSNRCGNRCSYCGINRNNTGLKRYDLTREEILDSISAIASAGIKTVILQSGESDKLDPVWMMDLIVEIKERFDMAITLSVGEKSCEEYRMWKNAGADRYLLKIETSNAELYRKLHPGMYLENRSKCLLDLIGLGYQTGSGSLVGLKGQTPEMLAEDIIFFKKYGFDMLGIGPFIPHPRTLLKKEPAGSADLALKMVAAARIVTKNTHIPATTALSRFGDDTSLRALNGGANVVMLNFTPESVKNFYEIYPRADVMGGPGWQRLNDVKKLALSAGRDITLEKGDSLKLADGRYANV